MAFDNNYPNRKDWRKPYNPRSWRSFCSSVRNHGIDSLRRQRKERRMVRQSPMVDTAE